MGKSYSDDLRERVVAAIEAGHTRVKLLSCTTGFEYCWRIHQVKRKRETGSVSPPVFIDVSTWIPQIEIVHNRNNWWVTNPYLFLSA
jgi:hypothetical protein